VRPGSATIDGADPPASAIDAAIHVDGLVKRYGERSVLDGVSLSVERGELVALLGPNGAGKTTTVEIVEGYRRRDGGTVRVLGEDPGAGGPRLRARVGLMLQGGGIDPRAEPRETVVQYGRFHADPRHPDELLDLVGLRAVARTRFRRLSGGERQRLGLALALVGRPEVLAILLTSHDLGEVERMADRVAVMTDGRIVASGTPAELVSQARPQLRFRLDRALIGEAFPSLERALAAARPGVRLLAGATAGSYRIEPGDGVPDAAIVAALATWCAGADRLIVDLHAGGGTLEDAYLQLVNRDPEAVIA
jgi:ABC-2 type transport system ATP-binding protein